MANTNTLSRLRRAIRWKRPNSDVMRQRLREFVNPPDRVMEQGFIIADPHPYGPVLLPYEEWRRALPSEARRLPLPTNVTRWRVMCTIIGAAMAFAGCIPIYQQNIGLGVLAAMALLPIGAVFGCIISRNLEPWDARAAWFAIRTAKGLHPVQLPPWGALHMDAENTSGLASAGFVRYLHRQDDSRRLLTTVTHGFTGFDAGLTVGMIAIWVIGVVVLVVVGAEPPPPPPTPQQGGLSQ